MRFPGFEGEWRMCRLGDIAIKVGSGITPKGGNSVYKQFGHYFVRSQNIGNGHLLLNDIAFIDNATHHKQISTEIKVDDVLLNITGASIGRCAIATQQIEGGNVNQHVCIIRLKSIANPIYICNFILSNKGQKQIDSFQAGGNRQGLNFEQIKTFLLHLPCRIEQDKLAKLLSLLDSRLSTQNKIIEQLESLIKGLCVYIYRLQDKRSFRVAELGCRYNAILLSKEDLSDEGNECIIYGELFTKYGCVIDKIQSKTKKSCNAGSLSKGHDILFPASTTVDAVSLIAPSALNDKDIILGGDMFGITINKEFNNEAISYIINYVYKYKLAKYAQGSTIVHIYYDDIKNVEIFLPNKHAQDSLAGIMRCLSARIETEKNILLKFKMQKEYFLQNLFI